MQQLFKSQLKRPENEDYLAPKQQKI